ncbi:MAG: molybdopterin molybdenumtransferase MoeA, partial [Rhodospirillaceae bacterium]|nr:molybdopterin molybdenumtransferase MoeA [Rhodospirillaceae bacterium]
MAQLSDDCFAFGGALTPLDDALALLEARISVVAEVETVALRAALGRILADDIRAGRSVPPHDNSAVDGYAV